ncbi:HU family DNA-binding protein [Odoribacter sp. OttesenSCG-928-A06]|nr:HU family DNA-binding protein [Odoribacter sp. OttesenSCG-928-A06]
MHKFVDYISDLLFLHDCVIIPDFGGFICNYKNAYIDETTGMIYPPSKEILFNKNLKHNDGLLVNWIANKESISFTQATKQVEAFCDDLKIKLHQGKRVSLNDIGVFYTDRRFNIIFESGDHNFLIDAYGMDKTEANKVYREENTEGKKSENKTPERIQIPSHNQMYPYINMESRHWVHRLLKYGVAAAILAGAVFATLLGVNYFESQTTPHIQNTTTTGFTLPSAKLQGSINNEAVQISPNYDYVNYDPLMDCIEE